MSDLFKDFHAQLKSIARTDINIIEFVNDTLKPGMSKELFLSQRVILKSIYNLPFDKDEQELMDSWIDSGKTNYKNLGQGREYKEVIMQCGQRGSKCVDKNTIINTKEHGFIAIGDLIPKPTSPEDYHSLTFNVMTPNGYKPVAGAISQKDQKSFVVKTKKGFTHQGSDKHRVRVMGHNGKIEWKLSKDLTTSDYVCIDRSVKQFESTNPSLSFKTIALDELKLCRFFGLLIGDGGCTTSSSLVFTSADEELGQEFITLTNDLFGYAVQVRKDPKSKAVSYGIFSKEIREFVASLGLTYSTAYFKSIPSYVNKASHESVKAFLQGLFDTDGWADSDAARVGYCTASDQLAREVQHMLTYYGVVASVNKHMVNYIRKSGEQSYAFKFVISGASYNSFRTNIGFGLSRKQSLISNPAKLTNGSTVDKVPHLGTYLRVAKAKQGFSPDRLTWNRIRHQCYGNTTRVTNIPGGLTYPKILEASEFFGKTDSTKDVSGCLKLLYDDNYYFDQVVSVEESVTDLYDICVPDGNQYLGNGFIHHNTFLSALITAFEIFRLVTKDDPQDYLGVPSIAPIFITVMATTAEQGVNTIFGYLCGFLEGSSYFQTLKKNKQMNVTATDIEFPHKRIKVSLGHSNASAILGRTAIVVAFDELAFFSVDQGNTTNAPEIYARISRSTTNFSNQSKRITSSSVKERGDFLEFLLTTSWDRAEQGTLIYNLTTFDLNPKVTKQTDTIEIDYARDMEQALRDYENIRPGITSGFLSDQLIKSAITYPNDMYVTSEPYYHTDTLGDKKKTYIRKRILEVKQPDEQFEYICHVDPAIKNDTFAVVIGHKEYCSNGIKTVIDQILEWIPEKHAESGLYEVDYEDVYNALLYLNKFFKFKQVTFDQWESHGTIQRMFREGIPTFKHTFGRANQMRMYKSVKTRMISNLLELPDNPSMIEELENLAITNGAKVDHPKNKKSGIKGKRIISKDICDCIAVINWYIAEQEMQYDNNPEVLPISKGTLNTIGLTRTTSLRSGNYQSRFTDAI